MLVNTPVKSGLTYAEVIYSYISEMQRYDIAKEENTVVEIMRPSIAAMYYRINVEAAWKLATRLAERWLGKRNVGVVSMIEWMINEMGAPKTQAELEVNLGLMAAEEICRQWVDEQIASSPMVVEDEDDSAVSIDEWGFTTFSEVYGGERFGPYDDPVSAIAGMLRVQAKAASLNDGVPRTYCGPLPWSEIKE